jgi:hypothetical protein
VSRIEYFGLGDPAERSQHFAVFGLLEYLLKPAALDTLHAVLVIARAADCTHCLS